MLLDKFFISYSFRYGVMIPARLVLLHPGITNMNGLNDVMMLIIKQTLAAVFAASSTLMRRTKHEPTITPTKLKKIRVSTHVSNDFNWRDF